MAQKTGAEAISPSVGQKSYPTIASDDWRDPPAFGELPFNTPVLIDNKGGKQHLALISRDMLTPLCRPGNLEGCNISVNKPGREFRLVTHWSQSELRAWAYERSEVDNTPPKPPETPKTGNTPFNPSLWSPGKATIVRYTPLPEINEGLHWNLSWEAYCGSTVCSFKPLKPVPPTPPTPPEFNFCPPGVSGRIVDKDGKVVEELPAQKAPSCVEVGSLKPESKPATSTPKPPVLPQLTVYVGSQKFLLDGKEGIFPISASLAKALREAESSVVKIITPRKWEATINPEAVRNLSVIYQESKSSQMPR